jgi:hypothetical protein
VKETVEKTPQEDGTTDVKVTDKETKEVVTDGGEKSKVEVEQVTKATAAPPIPPPPGPAPVPVVQTTVA